MTLKKMLEKIRILKDSGNITERQAAILNSLEKGILELDQKMLEILDLAERASKIVEKSGSELYRQMAGLKDDEEELI